MDLSNRKGFVKIGAGAGVIIILAVLLLFSSSFLTSTASTTDLSGQVTGSMMDEAFGSGQGTNGNSPVLIDFTRLGDSNDNEGNDDQGDTGDSGEEEDDDETEGTDGSGGFFIPASTGSTGGGGGPVITCHHMECNYDQRACVQVSGEGADECTTFDDCIHKECDTELEECLTVDEPGENECTIDDDCVDECIPPYLDLDKTANPSQVLCEEVEITLTVSGEGEICDPHYPVDVVLVFDNSGSMDDDGYDDNISDWQPIGDSKIAAKTFVDLLGTNDKSGLVSFNTIANPEHPLTFNKNNVKTAINAMSAGGWTNMSHGIELANQELIDNGRADIPWVEVLLSDGNNNCGSDNPPPDCHERVFSRAQEAADNGIVIYTIALGQTVNQSIMQEIADITGGNFYYAPNSSDLQDIYEDIAKNVTDMAASDVTVVDYLPVYAELNLSSLPAGCDYNDTLRKITCDIGEVRLNETYEFMFRIYMYQVGYNLTNLYPSSGVDYIDYNLTGQFLAFPETHVTVIAYDCDHTECNYDQEICELVDEPGVDECEDFATDCPTHTICNYDQDTCETVEGAGTDECSDYQDCIHTECNYQTEVCDTIDALGISECTNFATDCPQHTICNYDQQSCETVEGQGSDECSLFSDCIHTECNYDTFSCDPINASGIDECETFEECEKHTECDYQLDQCITVEGLGVDECSTFDDCAHMECDYCLDLCVEVDIPGTDECTTFDECIHTECNYQTEICDTIETPGIDECTDFATDCPQHTICDNFAEECVMVEGAGVDECSDYQDCIHTECNYQTYTCNTIDASGTDECESFLDCPQHTICNYDQQACETVEGQGSDECSNFAADCLHDICDYSSFTCKERPIYEQGDSCNKNTDCFDKICDYDLDICKPVEPGTPGDVCSTWDDCVECPNGVLDPGEECEQNSHCDSPPKSKCVGVDWHQYSNPGTCLGDCTCEYDLVIRECDSRCMGNCDKTKIKVLVGHWMSPAWPVYPGQFPYGVKDDIYIEAMTTDNDCLNEEITITYNWCSCPNLDPEQSAIETTIWPPKYDRLCTANARSSGTESLACTPCRKRDWDVTFTQTNKWYREWTGTGIPGACEGTFQIDLRDDDCYVAAHLGKNGPPALGCAGHCEDHPGEKPAMRGICSISDTCELVAASVSGEACKTDSDCVEEETHMICQNQDCVEVPVSVSGEACTRFDDCQPDPEPEPEPEPVTHLECIDLDVCGEVEGPGPDLCAYWKDCSGPYEPPEQPPM